MRQTALLAGVLMAVVRAHFLWGQIKLLARATETNWLYAALILFDLVVLLAFPLLLVALYQSHSKLGVSKRLREVALGAAVVQFVFSTVRSLYTWLRALPQDWREMQSSVELTEIAKLWHWLRTPSAEHRMWDGLALLSDLAFVVFLLALFRYGNAVDKPETRRSNLLPQVALLTVVATGLSLILTAGWQMQMLEEAGKMGISGGLAVQSTLRRITLWVPSLCQMVAGFVIYKGCADVLPMRRIDGDGHRS